MKCKFYRKHSRPFQTFTTGAIAFAVLVLGLLLPSVASAQMFTVQDDDNRRFQFPQSSIHIGLELASFDYVESGLIPSDARIYEFEGPLLRVEVETPNVSLYMGTGGNLTGLEDRTYFQAGAQGRFSFDAMEEDHFTIRIPIMIQTDITTVTNTTTLDNSQFQQGAFFFGLGVTLEARPSETIRVVLSGIPKYGVSFSSGGTFGGHAQGYELGSRISLDNIFGSVGLIAGYEYKYRVYDVDQNEFDYDLTGHNILVGITF